MAELPKQLTLSADDDVGSLTQLLRNMKAQIRPAAGNILHDGYVIKATRGEWRITPSKGEGSTMGAVLSAQEKQALRHRPKNRPS